MSLGSGAVKHHLPQDIGLGLLALAVLGGAAYTLRAPAPVVVESAGVERPLPTASPTTRPTAQPSTPPSVSPTPASSAEAEQVLLVGPDLVGLEVPSAAAEVASVSDLAQVAFTPTRVVVQVLAGSKTTVRTRNAVLTIRARWASVPVVVVGPLSANDRLSAAAVKQAAAQLPDVVVLDPVELDWRADATSAALDAADRADVASALESALATSD